MGSLERYRKGFENLGKFLVTGEKRYAEATVGASKSPTERQYQRTLGIEDSPEEILEGDQ